MTVTSLPPLSPPVIVSLPPEYETLSVGMVGLPSSG
jgi:hypothetical protein